MQALLVGGHLEDQYLNITDIWAPDIDSLASDIAKTKRHLQLSIISVSCISMSRAQFSVTVRQVLCRPYGQSFHSPGYFKAKKKALKQEIKEAKANIFGHKLRTPEEEKARLEKRIVKLQAKFMEMYGETPDENSSNEEANEAGDKVEQPLQVVEVNQ